MTASRSVRVSRFLRWAALLWLVVIAAETPRPPAAAQDEGEAKFTNRLARESSPYLRLHAHNPVDWYPWGPEALAKARRENKPIFLSVGYSSCYWCHVMERESFVDEEIARFLNDNFVCIKVDREERPDIDAIYMAAVQIISRRGGWPMSVFLTPEGKPFFGGTYFPARDGDRGAAVGFLSLVRQVDTVWKTKEAEVRTSANELVGYIQAELHGKPADAQAVEPAPELLDRVQASLAEVYDPEFGGFGFSASDPSRPKFPEPSNLLFLLRRARQAEDQTQAQNARQMVVQTLNQMQQGGIWDHVGGGFHRYSTDRFWRIPHFEKMLYDNGQLASVYAQAYALTKQEDYRRTAAEILEFVLREMRHEQGGFLAAIDAESEQVEGKYYRWDLTEARTVLGDEFAFLAAVYGLDREPNFEESFYVPLLKKPLRELAAERNLSEEELWKKLQPLRARLMAARSHRPRPMTDTKILVGWNGMMIRGLADAGEALTEPRYVQAAADAARFVLDNMRNSEGRLWHTWTAGKPSLNAYVDDYALLVDGLLALHRVTKDDAWLQVAVELSDLQIKYYWDEQDGGFFFTATDHEELIARVKQPTDNAVPSGNSVAAENLVALARLAARPDYLAKARRSIQAVTPLMDRIPRVAPRMAIAIADYLQAPRDE